MLINASAKDVVITMSIKAKVLFDLKKKKQINP